ncbi:hypothetical protein C8F04DRAFT_1317729 [Mycena alexandri]|uniref:Uncharacterized protein n=1 Tax=Mycena alexandri TaxID=1745969 RepID=A0AAD6T5C3_9AGAR|nr:hypothetical protein C8F04DRAFT_1317729 [Mycena alexandri]
MDRRTSVFYVAMLVLLTWSKSRIGRSRRATITFFPYDSVCGSNVSPLKPEMHLAAYVRDARPSDLEEISAFEARSFADDPEMNWFGGLLSTAMMDDNPPFNVRKLENLRIFLDSVNRSVTLVGGRVTVVVVPAKRKLRHSPHGFHRAK